MRIRLLVSVLFLLVYSAPAQTTAAAAAFDHNIRNAKHLIRLGENSSFVAAYWQLDSTPSPPIPPMIEDLRILHAPQSIMDAIVVLDAQAKKPLAARGEIPGEYFQEIDRWTGSDPWAKFYFEVGTIDFWAKTLGNAMASPGEDSTQVVTKYAPQLREMITQHILTCTSTGAKQCSERVIIDLVNMGSILNHPPSASSGTALSGFAYDVESIFRIQAQMSAADRRHEDDGFSSDWRVANFIRLGAYISQLPNSWGTPGATESSHNILNNLKELDASSEMIAAANRLMAIAANPPAVGDDRDRTLAQISEGVDKLAGEDLLIFPVIGGFIGQLVTCSLAFSSDSPRNTRAREACTTFVPHVVDELLVACGQLSPTDGNHCNPLAIDSFKGIKRMFERNEISAAKGPDQLGTFVQQLSASYAGE